MQVQAIGTSDIEKHIAILLKEDRLSDSSIKKVVDVLNDAYAWAVCTYFGVYLQQICMMQEPAWKRLLLILEI